jgi:moderate conductance mechanosensitive channel
VVVHELLTWLGIQAWAELVRTVLHVVLILLLAWASRRLVDRVLGALRQQMSPHVTDGERAKRAATLARVLSYMASVGIWVLAALLVLHELGIAIAPLLAAAGVVGIAVGFGAQSLVKDYFSGIVMLLEDQARVGDSIEAGGKSGVVEAVTLRHLRLRDYEGHVHYVPNGAITTVTNRSRGYAYAVVEVGLASQEDTDRAVQLMRQVGHELRESAEWATAILEELDVAGVDKWTDSVVVLRARIKTEPQHQGGVRRAYLQALRQAFADAGIVVTQGG